jgi:hypothetical protein
MQPSSAVVVSRYLVRPMVALERLTGVAFCDFHDGQTGVALNAIELHPILRLLCLTG